MPDPARIATTVELIREFGGPVRPSDVPGLSRARVRAAIAGGALRPLRRGVVLPRDVWESAGPQEQHLLLVKAAIIAFPGSWASHASAAQLRGLSGALPGRNAHLTVHLSRTGTTYREPGLIVHGQQVPLGAKDHVLGLPCSSLPRTCIEVAARRSVQDALGVMDAGLRLYIAAYGGDTRSGVHDPRLRAEAWQAFDASVAPYRRHRWVTWVGQAIRWANPAAESRLKSLSRAEILMANLPEPECGVPLQGDDGQTYWVDLWWKHRKLIGEVDGLIKYTDVSVLVAEKRRQEALIGSGRSLVRWGFAQVSPSPHAMLARLRPYLEPPRGSEWS